MLTPSRTVVPAVLLTLLVAACGVAPATGGQTPTPTATTASTGALGLLSGEVSGLAAGDTVVLGVAPYDRQSDPLALESVREVTVSNGAWEMALDGLPVIGDYIVGPSAEGYVSMPRAVWFTLSEVGAQYRYVDVDFDLVKPEEAEAKLDMPLCPDDEQWPPPPTATPTPVPPSFTPAPGGLDRGCEGGYRSVRHLSQRGMTGTIAGLPDGVTARVWIDRISDQSEDWCLNRAGPARPECPEMTPRTGPIDPMPRVVPSDTVATIEVTNGRWGIVDPSLAGTRLLVGFEADAPHGSVGGYNVAVYMAKYDTVVDAVDFTFIPLVDDGTPTVTAAAPHSVPTPTPTEWP